MQGVFKPERAGSSARLSFIALPRQIYYDSKTQPEDYKSNVMWRADNSFYTFIEMTG